MMALGGNKLEGVRQLKYVRRAPRSSSASSSSLCQGPMKTSKKKAMMHDMSVRRRRRGRMVVDVLWLLFGDSSASRKGCRIGRLATWGRRYLHDVMRKCSVVGRGV